MYFAVEIDGAGAHPAADANGDSLAAATAGQAAARAAETAGIDLVTLTDSALPPPGGSLRLEAAGTWPPGTPTWSSRPTPTTTRPSRTPTISASGWPATAAPP